MNIKNCLKNILCFTLLFAFNRMNGQDKIITVDNDTIVCRILSVSDTRLNYEQTEGEYTVGKFIPISKVLEYYKNAVKQQSETVPDKLNRPAKPDRLNILSNSKLKHWQFGILFGGAYLLSLDDESDMSDIGISTEQNDDYNKKIRNGISFGANVYYFIDLPSKRISIGPGIKYRLSSFSSSLDAMILTQFTYPTTYYSSFALKENVYLSYYGLSSAIQGWTDAKNRFKLAADISLGYVHYREEARFDEMNTFPVNNILATGNTIGADVGVSFYYYPLKYLSIGANTGFFWAVFKHMTIADKNQRETVDLDDNNYLNASQLNYSIGIQFHF
jgi:hypothetical protein